MPSDSLRADKDRGDAELGPPFAKLCTALDVLGEDNARGLSISLEADTPVCKLPFKMLRRDLLFAGETPPGEGYKAAGVLVVGVDGKETVEL